MAKKPKKTDEGYYPSRLEDYEASFDVRKRDSGELQLYLDVCGGDGEHFFNYDVYLQDVECVEHANLLAAAIRAGQVVTE